MHKINSLRQRRIEKKQGLNKSEQTYRGNVKNFAKLEEEVVVEAPKPKKAKKAKKAKKSD